MKISDDKHLFYNQNKGVRISKIHDCNRLDIKYRETGIVGYQSKNLKPNSGVSFTEWKL